ncbi:hypothetical protein [Methylobacterium aerolatum]|uniref:Uncharacterized protein n=1 Tax=Methylobacterium aerolatum TaxID=418708 RepID=A0ABU0I1W4_9HYPH|nr:hypothetical protein [Methylobacterium aerolatum]MDQ0448595.1 hypothetical protein [Methylobacterium aerolatum]GJD37341.1 hypothetical protein FMGBMHLM_4269 [Methylobacterium aerolatum]
MTDLNALVGANEPGRAHEPSFWVRATVERPRRHQDGLLLELRAVDPSRPGRLTAFMTGDFIREVQTATGILLDPSTIFGEHQLKLTVTAEPRGDLSAQVAGFVRETFLLDWAEQDAAIRDGLEADRIWDRQHNLPAPSRLRRVFLIEPEDGGSPSALRETLERWWEHGIIELIRHPVAFEEAGSVAALEEAIGCAWDQFEWGTLDLVIIAPGTGFAFRALSDEGLLRRIAVLPVPIVLRKAGAPTLLDTMAHRCFDCPDEILTFLTGILREEVRVANTPRLAAIAEMIEPASARRMTPAFHGPLFD